VATHGRVTMGQGVALDSEGVASNVAIVQAEKARQESLNVDGKFIRPDWVAARGLSLGESLRVGSGVTLTDGCVQATHIATDAVTTEKINAGAVTANEISVSSLSAISANLGTITAGSIGVGSGGVTISNDGGSTGIHIGANQIYAKASGVVTFLVNGPTGEVSARKFTLIADAANSVDLSLGTHVLATSITVGAQTLGDIQANASAGAAKATSFAQAAVPTALNAGDLWCDTDDGNKLYRAAAAGANEIKAGEWVAVQDTAYTSKNVTFAQTSIPTALAAGDLWIDTDDSNKTYRAAAAGANEIKAGEWVAVLDPFVEGNGVVLNASNQIAYINTDSGVVVRSATSGAGVIMNSSGIFGCTDISNPTTTWTFKINNSDGAASFKGTIATNSIIKIIQAGTSSPSSDQSLRFVNASDTVKGLIWYNTDSEGGLCIKSNAGYVSIYGSGLIVDGPVDAGRANCYSTLSGTTTLYTSADAAFTTTYLTIGDATRYLRMYIWSSGDPTTFRQTSGGAQGTWGNAGDMGVSLGGSLWFRQSGGWQRQDS